MPSHNSSHLYLIQHLLLELPLNLLTMLICVRLAVEVKKSAKVELGCLQELDFADVDLNKCQQNPSNNILLSNAHFVMGRCLG